MLVAFLLQAAIVQAPAPPPPSAAEIERRRECNMRVIEAMEEKGGRVEGSALLRRGDPGRVLNPLYKPGELPDEGVYAAVARTVDGCPVPTPISLRNAPDRR